ncbi:hypothetical protein QJQ45_030084, partial [Haematococcus lacustris]
MGSMRSSSNNNTTGLNLVTTMSVTPPVLGTPLELNGPYSSTDNPVFDAAAPPQEPAPAPTRSSRAVQPMALVSMAVPELTGTSRLAFRAFSLKLRAYLGLNLHIPVNAFHHLLASSAMDGVFFQSIADAYEQLVDGWGDEADRAEALEALLDLVEEQLIDPPSHQAGLDPALVLGGKGCSSAKAFATAFESAVNEAIRRGTLTHFTAINHLFSHCLRVPTMRQEQRTKLRDEAVRLFHQAVPDAEDRQDQRAFRAALHAVSAAHENLLDSMRYVPAAADRPPLRAEQDPVSEEVLVLRQQLAELQARALPQPPHRQRARQPMPQPLLQPMPHHLQQPMQQMGYPMSHPAMQQPLPSVMPMSQAFAAPPMQLGYAAMPQPALRSAPMQHAPMQTQRSRPAKTCPLHPYAGHDLAECRQFQTMPPHEQQRVIGGSAPRAAHAVAAHPAGSVVSRVITDPRQRTPLLDRGYVPDAPAHAQHTCSYCHKRYHAPERCFKLYPHMQAAPSPSLSGPARAHTVSAEGSGLGAWDMSGHWVSQDARVQPLSYPEHGSFCIITANAARAVPFTPMSAALPAGATHTLPKAAAPAPPAAPATTPTMGSVFATQPGLQELAVQLQHLAQRVTRIEQHLSPSVAPVDTAAHIAAEPPRAAAVRAACHTAVPNQHLTYFSNVTVQSGCAVADSEGQLHLLQGVMLDGGSDSCLISHECAAALNLPLTPCSRRLSTASGAEALATQVATLRVSLSYGTPHAMVHDLEAIVMPPGSPLAYDLLLGANFLSQTKGVCDVYDRQFSYCPRLHSHGDVRTSHSLPVTGPKGCLPLLYSAPMGSSQLLVACTAVSHSQVQPCATSGTASAMIHTSTLVHVQVGTTPAAAGTTTPSAVSRGGDLAAMECALSRVATGDEPIPAGSGVKPVRSPAQPVTRRGGGAAVTSVPSSALDPAAQRMSMPTSAPQPSASHLAVGTAAARRSAIPLTTAPPPQVPPMPPLRASPPPTPQCSSREVAWGSLSPLRLVLSLLFLFWLPSMVSCLPPPVPGMCSPAITCSAITMVLPDGPAVNPSPQQYTQLPNGVLLAQHAALSQQQAHRMAALVAAHPGAFAHSLSDLTGYKGPRGAFRIELSTTDPIITKPRRYSDLELQVTDKKVQELEEAGIIQPVTGPCDYASAPTLPMKKDAQGQWTDTRFCIDFRRLNDATKSDRYGLPLPEEMFARVGSARWFSKLDMRSGFLQIPVHPDDQLKTAFWARNRLYCYTRMPFGLKNASAEYQRVMDAAITSASLSHCCMAFIDDVLVYSDSFEAHCEHVQALLQMLQTIGMFAHPEKTILAADRVEYLGHDVSVHGLTPTQAKCQALRDMPAPTDVSSLRTAMGVFNYYRCYIPDFSIIAAPITSLTRKGVAWCWGSEQQAAYSTLKDRICTPGLVLRRFDPERPLVLHTDWSREGCAGILGQVDTNGDEYMVACCSRSCNVHERNYASYTGEMLAVVWAVKTLRFYLHGRHFTIVTDHQPLSWLMSGQHHSGQVARWAMQLQEYDFTVKHRPGVTHQNADSLSRFPRPTCADSTGACLDPPPALASLMRGAATTSPPNLPSPTLSAALAAITSDDLLLGNQGSVTDAYHHEPNTPSSYPSASYHTLTHRATSWIRAAQHILTATSPATAQLGVTSGLPDSCAVRMPLAINTTCVASSFFPAVAAEGVVLLELHGGLGAGLEMLLRNGVHILRYISCDTSPSGQHLILHRLSQLSATYHGLLPPAAYASALTSLPQDVGTITSADLVRAGARGPHQWLVVAGWECPHHPTPGSLAGLHDPVSSTFLSTMRLVGCLQQLQPLLRPGYVLVNTTHQHHSQAHRSQFTAVYTSIGTPLCLNAQLGAGTWWTNLCDPNHFSAVLQHAQPPSARALVDIISPVSAVPTAHFGGKGALLTAAGKPREPTISPKERPAITERYMDATTAGSLYAISAALHRANLLRNHAHNCLSLCTASHALAVAVGGGAQLMLSSHTSTNQTCSPLPTPDPVLPTPVAVQPAVVIAQLADVADTERDIHDDTATMQLLQHHTLPAGLPHAEQRRAQRRAQAYVWDSHKLLRRMADGSTRIVPAPAERPHLVSTMHNNTGHFGGRRTAALLQHTYWWRGLAADAQAVVARCTACDRVKAAFNAKSPELHSLPIRALFYRWGVDLCGPFIPSRSGHKYIMVCIEHLSKWVEIILIPNKEATTTASAFAHHVLGRYGACAEVVTDGGTEFQGAFAELLQRALIDHRTTSANHPQSNGLSERCVQTVKACLRKHCTSNRVTDQWDDALPMIALGYRCSTQESTRMTPYELLFARKPVVPPAIAERVEQPINFDDPELAAELVMHRAAAVTDNMVIAMDNQAAAQHRDQLRYAMTRSGSYQPAAHSFKPGDFVYLRLAAKHNMLQLEARPEIYRVVVVKDSGVAVLTGKCGTQFNEHISNLSPCHLLDLDGTIDVGLARPHIDHPCEVCRFTGDEAVMLLCDGCGTGWHTYCLTPALDAVPEGDWLCPRCVGAGVTYGEVKDRQLLAAPAPPPLQDPFLSKAVLSKIKAARELHGRVVHCPASKAAPERWGVVTYKGDECRPKYFRITFQDGSIIDDLQHAVLLRKGWLMPLGSELPRHLAASTVTAATLPDHWLLSSTAGVLTALHCLLPGSWHPSVAAAIAQGYQLMQPTNITPQELRVASTVINLDLMHSLLDPCTTTPIIISGLELQPLSAQLPLSLSPAAYRAQLQQQPIDAIISSPDPTVLDLLLPLAVIYAHSLVCMLVPHAYLSDAPPARFRWIQQLKQAERLLHPRPPLVCAHGGDTSAAPPNTKQAFLAAIAAHADCVEVDCARTSDGVLVVLHTRELQQLLGKRFVPGTQVGDLTSDEIRQLAWPGGQPVLSVRDAVLLTSPQQVECVTLDLKTYQDSTGKAVDSEQVAAAVVQLVHDTRCSNCLVWAKTDEVGQSVAHKPGEAAGLLLILLLLLLVAQVVSLIKALSPGQRAGFILMNETADARAAGMHLPLRLQVRLAGSPLLLLTCPLQAAEVVGAHHTMVDEATLQLLRTHGKQLFTWTINDPKVMRRVLDVGVDALVTNKL